jgi:hypothetical protein
MTESGGILRTLNDATDFTCAMIRITPRSGSSSPSASWRRAGDTRLDEVFALLDAVLVTAPEYAWGHYGKAFALKHVNRVKEGLAALEKAHRLAPDEELITAHLGGWRMSYGFDVHSLDSSVALLNGVMDTLVKKYAGKAANKYYCGVVTEIIFTILWDMFPSREEAMAVARIAEQQDWSTPYVLETARSYVKPPPVRKLFQAMARARSNEPQGHWPANTVGYDIKLYVWTRDADEAQSVALEYLRRTEPASVEFQLEFFTTTLINFIHPKHSYAEQIGPPSWIPAAKTAPPADNVAGAPSGSRPSLPSQVPPLWPPSAANPSSRWRPLTALMHAGQHLVSRTSI